MSEWLKAIIQESKRRKFISLRSFISWYDAMSKIGYRKKDGD